ncbi:uncharacterized protein isoform X3 [Leptinotarsa decemlineata]|uniref:uncharacterized protein isoform X3 n=1 Tax=Leptinotarsa decemlineata TaxID=7539 RepID=UPI003D3074F9
MKNWTGVIYEGEFNKNGLFHGLGTLLYPNGQRLQGMWKNGRLEEDQTYIFACNEVFDENFKYCQQPDRRFHVEIQKDFGPVGQEFLTADQPTKKLRKGCYDVGLGFYDPNDGCIFSYPKKTRTSFSRRNKPVSFSVDEERIRQISEISKVMKNDKYFSYVGGKDDQFESNDGCNIFEIPTPSRVKWIEKHCRRSWDEPTGYRPDFYEKWMVGRKEDEGFRYPSSQKNVIDDSDTHPHVSKSRKQISKIKDHDRSKFMSFIQKRTSTVDGRYKNRSGAPKQELKKRVEERRAFHNRNNL